MTNKDRKGDGKRKKRGDNPMKNRCGTARANIIAKEEAGDVHIYFGTGVNPVNSPAQFFVAWGKEILEEGLIHTFNKETVDEGFLWFTDEEEAEAKYIFLIEHHINGGIR